MANAIARSADGSITFTPVAYGIGSAIITVMVNDGGGSNNIVSQSFTVTVNPVNQTPTLNALANLTLNENAPLQTVNLSGIGSGAPNESQSLTVTASSSNPSLIPTPTVTYTSPNPSGSITFAPIAYASGSATITVTVNEPSSAKDILTFTMPGGVTLIDQWPAQVEAMKSGGLRILIDTCVGNHKPRPNRPFPRTIEHSNPSQASACPSGSGSPASFVSAPKRRHRASI